MQNPMTLVVEDMPPILELVGHYLRAAGTKVLLAKGCNEALDLLRRHEVDVLFTDICLPTRDGISLLRDAVKLRPNLSSVIMTGSPSVETLVEGLHLGVSDYVTKPITPEKIRSALVRALRARSGSAQLPLAHSPSSPDDKRSKKADLVAGSAAMREILKLVERLAPAAAPVLIHGEIGVGKSLVARMIHERSPRAAGPFVHVNCSAQPPELLLRQLCSHESGGTAATGESRQDVFERARGGSLFVDYVHELPLRIQAGLLDRLQEDRPFQQPADEKPAMDVRLISASTIDLSAEVSAGRFHRGLYNHLSVVCIEVPPLRQRLEDVRLLAKHFLAQYHHDSTAGSHETELHFTDAALDCLLKYDWPGNVRELAKVVEHAVVIADRAEIGLDSLPESVRKHEPSLAADKPSVPFVGTMKEIERNAIREALDRCRGNKAAAARLLGVHRRTLYRMIAAKQPEVPTSFRNNLAADDLLVPAYRPVELARRAD